jgi:hypothetical protein
MNSKEALAELNSGANPAALCMRLIAFLGAAEKTTGGGLRETLKAWFEQPIMLPLCIDWEAGYRTARDEVRDMISVPVATDALREAIRARIRLHDSQIDPDCIGTGYDATDIITISELEQLVGFGRAAPARKEGEG